jgi:hypothetical protein
LNVSGIVTPTEHRQTPGPGQSGVARAPFPVRTVQSEYTFLNRLSYLTGISRPIQELHVTSMQWVMHWGTIIWRSQSAFFMRDSVQSETISGAALHSDSMPMAMHLVSIIWRSLIDFIMGASMHLASVCFASMHLVPMHIASICCEIIISRLLIDIIIDESMHPVSMHRIIIVWRSLTDFLMGTSMHEVSMHFIIIMRSFIDFIVGAFIGMGLTG